MIGKLKIGILAMIVLAVLASAVPAKADAPYFSGWDWGGYGWLYSYCFEQARVPYYALFPPVYYSYPVAVPYGQGPFAPLAAPGYSAEAPAAQTVVIVNPYVPGAGGRAISTEPDTSLIIKNPYVSQNPPKPPAAPKASKLP